MLDSMVEESRLEAMPDLDLGSFIGLLCVMYRFEIWKRIFFWRVCDPASHGGGASQRHKCPSDRQTEACEGDHSRNYANQLSHWTVV